MRYPTKRGLFALSSGRDYEILIGGPYKGHAYGHAALRVFGNGYDKTYDFGRYGKVWGTFNSKGEGVMRTWGSFPAYIAGENATGRTTKGYVFKASEDQDRAVMAYYEGLSAAGTPRAVGGAMNSFVLKREYDAVDNNCTTMTMDGVAQGSPELAGALRDVSQSKGRGLSGLERMLAPVGDKIFMPKDLEANVVEQRPSEVRTYVAPPER